MISVLPKARKRFGQNFLHDVSVIEKMATAIAAKENDHLFEIGPGHGALTKALLSSGAQLTALELDRDLIPILKSRFQTFKRFQLHQGDALHVNFSDHVHVSPLNSQTLRLVGNLPYNISTPLMFHALKQLNILGDMHFLLQKEVVDRLAAKPNTHEWGRLSIMVQYHCAVVPLFDVHPESFSPMPKVMSTFVRLIPHKVPEVPVPIELLGQIVRDAFNMRRKTLRNALKNWLNAEDFVSLNIDPHFRPENLTLADYTRITQCIHARAL